jgi:hypothetical protein
MNTNNDINDPEPKCSQVSCSLTDRELEAKRDNLIPGLFKKARSIDELETGYRFQLHRDSNTLGELVALIEEENTCCSFLSFVMSINKDDIILDVNGPEGTKELLKDL